MNERSKPYNELQNLPPEINLEDTELLKASIRATRLLAELKGYSQRLPNPLLLVNTIILQESKNSTAIENIVTTQDDLYKATASSIEDESISPSTREVLSYREAMYTGLELMRSRGMTINTIISIMQKLKNTDAGVRKTTGTKLANPITKEIIYTPPEGETLIYDKLSALENFINDDKDNIDPLIKMALIHYQFEAIHPFLDGNGRTGRILNVLFLVHKELLTLPVLFLSSFIIRHKSEYYKLLQEVTEKQNWRDWILYMLTAIAETSSLTLKKIFAILQLKEEITPLVKEALKNTHSNRDLVELIFSHPYVKIKTLEHHGIAKRQTASMYLQKLANAGILNPVKVGQEYYYINHRLMKIITTDGEDSKES